MEEEKLIKKQLVKNMFLNLIAFTAIFAIVGIILYTQVQNSLYQSSDKELQNTKNMMGIVQKINNYTELQNTDGENIVKNNLENTNDVTNNESSNNSENMNNNVNNITAENTSSDIASNINKLGNRPPVNDKQVQEINPRIVYIIRNADGNITQQNPETSAFTNVDFDINNIGNIYMSTINSQYQYRGVTYKITQNNETYYVQVLINIDAEENIMNNFKITLITTLLGCLILSILASYLLSKKTMKPIIKSWKKQTEFVQNASHELRTPLTIIQAKQELLLEDPNAKIVDRAEDITISLNETRRLSKLIKELMDLARTDSGKTPIKKEKIEIDNLIKEVAEPFIEMANLQNKKMKLNLNYGKTIEADVNKIHQLLVIVLDNSIKYTEKNDEITIETAEKDGRLVLDIKDTGIGISDEGIKHVFERFYRDDKAHSRETGGSGLGLSIASNIVEQHGGTIKALHNSPKGTIIEIKIK